MDKYFLSFADKRFHKSLKRIRKQAIDFGGFNQILIFNENNLEAYFRSKFSKFLLPYTFYLCAWKPQVILQAFERMALGDILLYADVGCHINVNGKKRFQEYCSMVENSSSGILATTFDSSMPEKSWTNGDTFDYFNCRHNKSITKSPQIQATTILIQKRESTISFLKKWVEVFEVAPKLADRQNTNSSNLAGYIEHRSDQSFFSILAKIEKVELISANEIQGSANWETEMIHFPIWAKRDRILDDGFWIHPTPGRLLLLSTRWLKKVLKKQK